MVCEEEAMYVCQVCQPSDLLHENIPTTHKVRKYFPPPFQPMYKTLSRYAHDLRFGQNNMNTRIDYSENSLILLAKNPNERLWKVCSSELLPTRSNLKDLYFQFLCAVCEQTYNSEEILTNHVDANHTRRSHYECALCNVTLASRSELDVHVARLHGEPLKQYSDVSNDVTTNHTEPNEPGIHQVSADDMSPTAARIPQTDGNDTLESLDIENSFPIRQAPHNGETIVTTSVRIEPFILNKAKRTSDIQ